MLNVCATLISVASHTQAFPAQPPPLHYPTSCMPVHCSVAVQVLRSRRCAAACLTNCCYSVRIWEGALECSHWASKVACKLLGVLADEWTGRGHRQRQLWSRSWNYQGVGRLPEAVQVFATHALPMWLTSKPAYLPATASVTSKLCSNRGLLIWLTSKRFSKHRSWPNMAYQCGLLAY